MSDVLGAMGQAWHVMELTFPVLGALFGLHLVGLVFTVFARFAGIGPEALPWRYFGFLASKIERSINALGRFISWAAVLMVVVQFSIVAVSYVFSIGSIWFQESVIYLHAALFLLAAAYTLSQDGHVRVDVFYRGMGPRIQSLVNFVGHLACLTPVMGLIIWVSYPYIVRSWTYFEGSKETSGIQAVFILKSLILVFALTLLLQGFALAVRAGHRLVGGQEPEPPEHGAVL